MNTFTHLLTQAPWDGAAWVCSDRGNELVELEASWSITFVEEIFGGVVQCPAGKIPLGGGGAITDPPPDLGQRWVSTRMHMVWSGPHLTATASPEPDGWEVRWQYITGQSSGTYRLWVVCAPG
jgi:hypothetical protein